MKIWYLVELFFVYLWELTKSNFQVALESLRPRLKMTPAFIEIPLEIKKDDELLILANLLTFTPGTVSMDVSDDKKFLYAHVLFAETADEAKNEIKNKLEKRIKRIFQ